MSSLLGRVILTLAVAAAGLAAAKRLPLPDEASQEQARALARQVFAADFQAAKDSPRQLSALAGKLLDHATGETRAAERSVLLEMARDAAVRAADVPQSMKAVAELAKTFAIDLPALKLQTLKSLARAVRGPDQSAAVIEQLADLADERIGADDYPLALEASRAAVDEARKRGDPALRKRAAATIARADQLAAAYAQVQGALETLRQAPGDAEANLAVGQFFCLAKGDWKKGLPHLAQGSDPRLALLAQTEQQFDPKAPAAGALALADAWWELAQGEQGRAGEQLRGRALYWYRLAVVGMTGLEKARVERLLADSAPEETAAAKPRRGPPLKIKVLQAVYGKPGKEIDVTAAVERALADDPFLPVRADRVLTGGVDPAPYQHRMLVLRYQVGRVHYERLLHEGTVETIPPVPSGGVALPEAAQEFQLVAARYGGGVTWIDVTGQLASLVSDPAEPFNFDARHLADDEKRKSCHALVVWFDHQGRRYVRVFERSRKCVLLP